MFCIINFGCVSKVIHTKRTRKVSPNLRHYHQQIKIIILLVFLIHGAKLYNGTIGIDTEDLIHLQGDFYGGWLITGRQGLVFLKGITDTLRFNPYLAGLLTLIGFACAVCVWLNILDRALGKESSLLAWSVCGALWISHPIMTEQFYFSLQSVEITVGMALLGLALGAIERWNDTRKVWWLLGSIALTGLVFSFYQVFVPMYLMGTVAIWLLESLREPGHWSWQEMKDALWYVVVFLIAFALNMAITQAFFYSTNYLSGQILWGKAGIRDVLIAMLKHIYKACTGSWSIYYNGIFGVLGISALVLLVVLCRKQRCKGTSIGYRVFWLVALCASPFLMTLVCGCEPVVRSQLILPMVTGILAYLCVNFLEAIRAQEDGHHFSKSLGRVVFSLLLAGIGIGAWGQLQVTARLYYTDACRYAQDVALGQDLIVRIETAKAEAGEEAELPIVLLGRKPFEGNNACVEGEVIGRSFFDYDVEVEPRYWWSSRRMLGFLHILGKDYDLVSKEQMEAATRISTYMPQWPAQGCVRMEDGMIVVKLSDIE